MFRVEPPEIELARQFCEESAYDVLETNNTKGFLVVKQGIKTYVIYTRLVPYETREELIKAVTREPWRVEDYWSYKNKRDFEKVVSQLEEKYGEVTFNILLLRIVPREKYATFTHVKEVFA